MWEAGDVGIRLKDGYKGEKNKHQSVQENGKGERPVGNMDRIEGYSYACMNRHVESQRGKKGE